MEKLIKSHSILGLCHEHMLGIWRYSFSAYPDFGNWKMWVVSFILQTHYSDKWEFSHSLDRSMHRPQCWLGHSVPAGNSTPVKQPVTSHITDWTVWVYLLMNNISLVVQYYVLSFCTKKLSGFVWMSLFLS